MLAIEAKGISKIYKGSSYAALNTLSLNVEPGTKMYTAWQKWCRQDHFGTNMRDTVDAYCR